MKPALSLRDRLRAQLADLKMPGALEALDDILAGLDGGALQSPAAIEALLGAQIALRNNRRLEAAMRSSRLPVVKTLRDFDFSFQPSIDERQVKELATLAFVHQAANLVLLGPPGVGKTHLCVALGMEAISQGLGVYFVTAHALVEDLRKAYAENRLERRMRVYIAPRLLLIDEVGYLKMDSVAATLFFQLVSARYERGSIVLTSNKSFGEWAEIFGDPVIATAILDRLLHHSHVINIRGESYRLREKKRAGLYASPVLRPDAISRTQGGMPTSP